MPCLANSRVMDFWIFPTLESRNSGSGLSKKIFFSKILIFDPKRIFQVFVQRNLEKCHELKYGVCCRDTMLRILLKLQTFFCLYYGIKDRLGQVLQRRGGSDQLHNPFEELLNSQSRITILKHRKVKWYFSSLGVTNETFTSGEKHFLFSS